MYLYMKEQNGRSDKLSRTGKAASQSLLGDTGSVAPGAEDVSETSSSSSVSSSSYEVSIHIISQSFQVFVLKLKGNRTDKMLLLFLLRKGVLPSSRYATHKVFS
jgi:hypothetical protein